MVGKTKVPGKWRQSTYPKQWAISRSQGNGGNQGTRKVTQTSRHWHIISY